MRLKYIFYLFVLSISILTIESCKKSDPRPVPTAAFTWANAGEGIVQFTDASKEADTYAWDFGDATTSTEKSPKHDFGKNGKFTVTLTVKNESGENKTSQSVDVSSIPAPKTDFTFVLGADGLVTFTNATTGATTYAWDFGDATTSTEAAPKKTYTENKKYSVTLTATGKGGTMKATKDVDVVSLKPIPDFSFAEAAGTVTFTNNSKNADTYAWDFGDGTTSTEAAPKKTYTKNGTYTVKLTATGKGGAVSASKSVVVAGVVVTMSINATMYIGTSSAVVAVNMKDNTEKWRYKVGSAVYSSPTLVDGVVYVGDLDQYFYAIDAQTGKLKWRYTVGDGVVSSPMIIDGIVYFGSLGGNVYALDVQTGNQKWSKNIGRATSSSPTVVNGILYIGSRDNNLYALDAKTGSTKWTFQATNQIDSSPAVADGIVYVGSSDLNFYALDATTGTKKWAFKNNGTFNSSPTVANGIVYFGSDNGFVYAYDAKTGIRKWAYDAGANIRGVSPYISDNILFIASSDSGPLIAIDAASGTKKWSQYNGENISSPVVAGNVVYISSKWDNKIMGWDVSTGKLAWSYPLTTQASVCIQTQNGAVYYSSVSGHRQ
jgi:outer membrane protein assembly factor BamB